MMGNLGVIADKTSDTIMDALVGKNYIFMDFDRDGDNRRLILMDYRKYGVRIKLDVEVMEKMDGDVDQNIVNGDEDGDSEESN